MSKESKALAKSRKMATAEKIIERTQSVKEEYAKQILAMNTILATISEAAASGYESILIQQDKAIDCTTTDHFSKVRTELEENGFTIDTVGVTVVVPELQNKLLAPIENPTGEQLKIRCLKISWPKKVINVGR